MKKRKFLQCLLRLFALPLLLIGIGGGSALADEVTVPALIADNWTFVEPSGCLGKWQETTNGIGMDKYGHMGAYIVTKAPIAFDGTYNFSFDYVITRPGDFDSQEDFGLYYSSTADGNGLNAIGTPVEGTKSTGGTYQGQASLTGSYYLYIKRGGVTDSQGNNSGDYIEFLNFNIAKAESVKSVTLNVTSQEVEPGATFQLTATTDPADKTVTWQSSKPSVATVDGNGLVTAIRVGTAVITATCGDKQATCTITVPYFEVTAETPFIDFNEFWTADTPLWELLSSYLEKCWEYVNTNTAEKEGAVSKTTLTSHKFKLASGKYAVTFKCRNKNNTDGYDNGTQSFRLKVGNSPATLQTVQSFTIDNGEEAKEFTAIISIPDGDPQYRYFALEVDREKVTGISGRDLRFYDFRIDKSNPVASDFNYITANNDIQAGRVYDNGDGDVGLGKIYVYVAATDAGKITVNQQNASPITLANSNGTVQSWGNSAVEIIEDKYNGDYIELTVDGKNIRNAGDYTLTIPEAFFLNTTKAEGRIQYVSSASTDYTVNPLDSQYSFALTSTPVENTNLKTLANVVIKGEAAGTSLVVCTTPVTFNGESYSTINNSGQLIIESNITTEGVYELSIPEGTFYVSDANGNCYPNSEYVKSYKVGLDMPEKVAELEPVLTSWQFDGWGTDAELNTAPVWNSNSLLGNRYFTADSGVSKTLSQTNLVRLEEGTTYSVRFTVDASKAGANAEFIIHNSLELGAGELAKVEQSSLESEKTEFCKSFTVSATGWYYLILRLTSGADASEVKLSNFALYPSTNETSTVLTTTVAKTDDEYYNVTIDDVKDNGPYTKDLNATGALPEGWKFMTDEAAAAYTFVDGGVKYEGVNSDHWIVSPGFNLTLTQDHPLNYIVTVKTTKNFLQTMPACEKGAFELWMSNTKSMENPVKLIDESEGVIDNNAYFSTLVKVDANGCYYFGIRPKSGEACNVTFQLTGFELKSASGYVTYSSNAGTVTISGENDKFENDAAINAFKADCTADVTLYNATSLVFPMELEFGANVNPNAIVDTKDVIGVSDGVNKVVKYIEGVNTLYRAEKLAMVDDYIPETTNSYPFNFGHNAITCSDVQLTRKQSLNNLMAVTLPFGLELTKLPDGVKVYKMKGSNDDYISFYEAKEDIPAYTSVLIKDERATRESLTLGGSDFVKSNSSKIGEVNIVDLGTTSGETWYCGYTTSTVGINAGSGDWASYDVYYFSANDGTFKKANNNGTLTIRPFRAIFLKRHTTPQQAPASFGVRLDNDAPTGIEAPQVVEEEASPAYTLDGIRVSENYRGIVVRKGQKTFEAQ